MGIRNRVQGLASVGNMAAAAGNTAAAGSKDAVENREAAGNRATVGNKAVVGNRVAAVCHRLVQIVTGISETMLAPASPRIMVWAVP